MWSRFYFFVTLTSPPGKPNHQPVEVLSVPGDALPQQGVDRADHHRALLPGKARRQRFQLQVGGGGAGGGAGERPHQLLPVHSPGGSEGRPGPRDSIYLKQIIIKIFIFAWALARVAVSPPPGRGEGSAPHTAAAGWGSSAGCWKEQGSRGAGELVSEPPTWGRAPRDCPAWPRRAPAGTSGAAPPAALCCTWGEGEGEGEGKDEDEGEGEGEVSHVSPGGLCAPGASGGAEPGVLVEQDVVEDAELRRVARAGDRALGGKGEVQGREHRAHHPLRQGLVQGVVVLGEVQVQVQVVQVVQMKVEEEVHLGEGGGRDQDGGDEHGGGEHGVEGGRGGHDLLVDPPLYAHPGKVDEDGGAGARCKVQGAR